MKGMNNIYYWIGLVSGIVITILLLISLAFIGNCNPETDCDSCLNGIIP